MEIGLEIDAPPGQFRALRELALWAIAACDDPSAADILRGQPLATAALQLAIWAPNVEVCRAVAAESREWRRIIAIREDDLSNQRSYHRRQVLLLLLRQFTTDVLDAVCQVAIERQRQLGSQVYAPPDAGGA